MTTEVVHFPAAIGNQLDANEYVMVSYLCGHRFGWWCQPGDAEFDLFRELQREVGPTTVCPACAASRFQPDGLPQAILATYPDGRVMLFGGPVETIEE